MEATRDNVTVDEQAAVRASVQLIECWYKGEPKTLDDIMHKDFAKRGLVEQQQTKKRVIVDVSKEQFIESANKGGSGLGDDEWEIISASVVDVSGQIATVKVVSTYLVDVCQLALVEDRWQIVNVLWIPRGNPPWRK